jgi:UDP:flavonoid glycosyltransferase YjiC (YdhE family)
MKKFLFTTLPSNDLGLLTRSLPIANELKKLGYKIAFSSPAKAPDRLIKDAGFENLTPKHPLYQIRNLPIRSIINPLKSKNFKDEYGNVISFFFKLLRAIPTKFAPSTAEVWNTDHAAAIAGLMNKNFVRANCEAYEKLIIDYDPDFIVDFWNPFACIAAKSLNKPVITVIQADGHPRNNGLIWWKEPPQDLPTALPIINQVITNFGLEPLTKLEELNIGDLTLVVGTPETDSVPDTANCYHIGPILWENPDIQLPKWIEQIDKDKPIIWVYSGNPRYAPKKTVFDSDIILYACIDVLAKEDVTVILTTGHHELPKELLPLPDNFHFSKYLPGLRLAKICDLLIHHGGYGSCQTGLYTGTPAVIIPTFSERESNARRIAQLGAGEFILPRTNSRKKKEIDLSEFREKIKRVLSTSTYYKNAETYSEKLKTYGGPQKAVEIIENFVNFNIHKSSNGIGN